MKVVVHNLENIIILKCIYLKLINIVLLFIGLKKSNFKKTSRV